MGNPMIGTLETLYITPVSEEGKAVELEVEDINLNIDVEKTPG